MLSGVSRCHLARRHHHPPQLRLQPQLWLWRHCSHRTMPTRVCQACIAAAAHAEQLHTFLVAALTLSCEKVPDIVHLQVWHKRQSCSAPIRFAHTGSTSVTCTHWAKFAVFYFWSEFMLQDNAIHHMTIWFDQICNMAYYCFVM